MLSKIKNMSRGGWVIIGFMAALLLVPSGMAVAKALKYTGIEGTNGNNSTLNQALVTSAGQVEVAPSDPASLFQNSYGVTDGGDTYANVATPPSGDALVLDTAHVGIYSYGSGVYLYLGVQDSTTCSSSNLQVGDYHEFIASSGVGDIDVPLDPGLVIPSGDSLCLQAYGTISATASASGYEIPASAAANGPLRRVHQSAVAPTASS